MRLIVTGGGTGGHLFPGIAVGTAIRQQIPGSQVLFIGTSRLLEQQTLTGFGFELATLECGGMKGLGLKARIRSLLLMPRAVLAALHMVKRFKPDLVFGVGGYVTGPVVLAAKFLGVPIVIHEQNSIPGMANRLAGKLADRVMISLPCHPSFPPKKTVHTGNPLRREILEAAGQEKKAMAPPTLLVLGGSQGAHRVNEVMVEAMEHLQTQNLSLRLIHQTGVKDREQVAQAYARLGIEAEVTAFICDMAGTYARADLVVSRAGATTLAELAAMGLPALLIPYPHAADDHQVANGKYYVDGKGCQMLSESGLTGKILARAISDCLHNWQDLHTMSTCMKTMGMPEATNRIVAECIDLVAQMEQH